MNTETLERTTGKDIYPCFSIYDEAGFRFHSIYKSKDDAMRIKKNYKKIGYGTKIHPFSVKYISGDGKYFPVEWEKDKGYSLWLKKADEGLI